VELFIDAEQSFHKIEILNTLFCLLLLHRSNAPKKKEQIQVCGAFDALDNIHHK
jgi:hypothetical protein